MNVRKAWIFRQIALSSSITRISSGFKSPINFPSFLLTLLSYEPAGQECWPTAANNWSHFLRPSFEKAWSACISWLNEFSAIFACDKPLGEWRKRGGGQADRHAGMRALPVVAVEEISWIRFWNWSLSYFLNSCSIFSSWIFRVVYSNLMLVRFYE